MPNDPIRLRDNVWVFPASTNLGVVLLPEAACVIDPGSPHAWDAARDLLAPYEYVHVFLTHGHGDHWMALTDPSGGERSLNLYLQPADLAYVIRPEFHRAALWGLTPPPGVDRGNGRKPSLRVSGSPEQGLAEAGAGTMVEIVPLPGHSPGSCGYLVDGGILFAGDSVWSLEFLDRVGKGYYIDRDDFERSLATISSLPASHIIASHSGTGPAVWDQVRCSEAVRANRENMTMLDRLTAEVCRRPLPLEEAVAEVHRRTKVDMAYIDFLDATVRAHIVSLCRAGRLKVERRDYRAMVLPVGD